MTCAPARVAAYLSYARHLDFVDLVLEKKIVVGFTRVLPHTLEEPNPLSDVSSSPSVPQLTAVRV